MSRFLKTAMGQCPKPAWFGSVLADCVYGCMLIPARTYWFLSSQDKESLTWCLPVCKGLRGGGGMGLRENLT